MIDTLFIIIFYHYHDLFQLQSSAYTEGPTLIYNHKANTNHLLTVVRGAPGGN